eukprot:CAMPEP_0206205508 /NCGR_PEP_ID=MMETSP0166-20121206/14270_1 /ASSEMBLY_ACC=CAM_ASM_000260 /TAXON_ID=95228 /ORGANISM="Vannella robusta, Strain DIVA3 518/3/11/1/6" /LENGTH=141 /DNA_ID=CAMNT_0053625557 /DNA_START=731 /DNA_END=1153 /DNA_ORIENTATION=-
MIKQDSPKKSKKEGFYVDCGGGGRKGEELTETAIREFHEETMWVYADHLGQTHEAALTEGRNLLLDAPSSVYRALCWEYHCFLMEMPYIDPNVFNEQFEQRRKAAGEKPRQFHWLTLHEFEQCTIKPTSEKTEARIRPLYP